MGKILKKLSNKEWGAVLLGVIFIFAQVYFELRIPDYMSEITTLVQIPSTSMNEILLTGGKMLLAAFGALIAGLCIGYVASKVSSGLSKTLRYEIYDKVNSFSEGDIKKFSTSSLITRSSNDITQIQMFVYMGMQMILKSPIMAIWAIYKIAGKGLEWSIMTTIAVIVLVIVVGTILRTVIPKFKKMQTFTDNINRVTRENLTGLRVVRAYNGEEYQKNKFENVNNQLTDTNLFTNRTLAFMMPTVVLINNGLSLGIYWLGAYLIDAAATPEKLVLFSNMVVFSQYALQVVMSFMMVMMVFMIWPRASVSAERINEVLDEKSSIKNGTETEGLEGVEGEIIFKHVSFKYPGANEYVLVDINFTVNKGETVAFIGSTGSGKSTLVNLAARLYDATEGEILIDGKNIQDYELDALYNKIGYVPQTAVLFKGSVKSNVDYGDNGSDDLSDGEVKNALRIAEGAEFVQNMSKGIFAEISQAGSNLSGGQKQRVAIARAVGRQPEFYIFDDSFSALDYRTDAAVRKNLRQDTSNVTNLIVAQRIGTVKDADQIIVLDRGKIVGKGKHEELLRNNEVYQEIAKSQLSEEELAI